MISLFTGFLTAILVLDSVLLVLLILMQLPKKDAGAGIAFGGGATDALFGAGSGNMLTKITKYLAGVFFGVTILLAILSSNTSKPSNALIQELGKTTAPVPTASAAVPASGASAQPVQKPLVESPAKPASTPAVTPSGTNK